MEKKTEIMYAVLEGVRIIALFLERNEAVLAAQPDQSIERVRADITRISSN